MRTSYKRGYGERQRQREFAAKLLMDGFVANVVAVYIMRKFDVPMTDASEVVRRVHNSLSRVEGK